METKTTTTLGRKTMATMRRKDPHLGTWMAPDPMAEKYPGISPYLYCSGDPVNVVDPQGDTLLFAPGVSERFKQQFAEAVEFMNAAGTSYNIAKIHASERVYYIKEGKKSTFQYDRMTIVWNPNRIVYNSYSGLLRSPATVLAHEFRHAEDYDMLVRKGKTQEEAKTILGAYNEQYDTEADRRAITETEQYVARAHGEIGSNQVTRTNHRTDPSKEPVLPDYSNTTLREKIELIMAFNRGIYL